MSTTDTIPTRSDVVQSLPSIPGRFAQVVARHADRIAISTAGSNWTYEELDQRSNAVACRILEHKGANSEPIALLMDHGPMLIAAILGVVKSGRLYSALDPNNPPARLTAILGDAGARLLLTDKQNSPLAHSLATDQMEVIELTSHTVAGSALSISADVPSENGAWLIYTSGSTGAPKGVWQNHRSVVHHTDVYGNLIKLTPDDRLSLLSSCSVAASATAIFAALLNGATLCPFHVRSQGVERMADWLRQQRITIYHSVPTVFRHFMRTDRASRSTGSLRLVRIGGEPILKHDVEAYRQLCPADCQLMHTFSSTETGMITSMLINKQTSLQGWRIPAGRAVSGVKLELINERGQPADTGCDGRISVRSAHLSQGYWRRQDLTNEAFQRDPLNPQTRIFITGDLGRFLSDGSLEHLGRMDRIVKIRGQRVDLAEVEAALQSTELFEESAATASQTASGEQRLVAYIVSGDRKPLSPHACRRSLRNVVPDHMIPNDFLPLTSLPRTPGGKVDHQALPKLQQKTNEEVSGTASRSLAPRRAGDSGHGPHKVIENKLIEIWQAILGVSPIRPDDDFFELGGTSIQSAQVLARIEEKFSLSLSPSVLTERSTIEALAPLLADHAVVPSPGPLVQLSSAATGRPLFLIHNGQGNVTGYGQLVRRLLDRPIYGLQAVGLQGEGWPLMSIPAMARRYLREVLATDSTGPYLLAGSCLGGAIAFEMACQLVQQGRPVGLVAMMNSSPGRELSPFNLAEDAVRDTFRILRGLTLRAVGPARRPHWLNSYRRFVANMAIRANVYYRAPVYPGTITLIVSADVKHAGEDPRLKMSRYAREARVIRIPGLREDLFVRPGVDELARQLHECLQNARQ